MSNLDGNGAAFGRIDEVVERAVEQGQVPGVVAAVACGESVHVATAGVMAVGGAPMRRDTLFRISSTTKPMTAAAVLSLVDDGLLELNGPVDELLPELADRRVLRSPDGPLDQTVRAERSITVRDLLTFTWGFGMQGAMFMAPEPWPIVTAALERQLSTFGPPQPGAMPDPDTWIARLGELPLLAQPGERWLYQSGSQVLGVLAARAAGAPFDVVLRERVLGPLGMTDTAFHAADTSRLATAYESRDGLLVVSDPADGQWSRPPLFPDGSGGLVSSAADVVAFGRMLMRGGSPVLKPATAAEMTRDQLTTEQRANVWPGFSFLDNRGWGFGLSVLDDGRYTWEGGFGTAWSNVPSQDLTIVVLTQRAADETGMPAVCDDVLSAALHRLSFAVVTDSFDAVAYNRAAWDREVDNGNEWTQPVGPEVIAQARAGDWSVVLIGYQPVPRGWFPAELAGVEVLCLASGGGQQGPVLSAAGAAVTVLDNSSRQLGRDMEVAAREGLAVRTVLGDMRDLSVFPDASFDVVFNPVSNVFCPDLAPVWRESFRVLRPGGILMVGFMNPDIFIFDITALDERGELTVRHQLPFSTLDLPDAERQRSYGTGPIEYSHSLTEQIGGQLAAGFTLTHLDEAPHHADATARYMPGYFATRAVKP